MATLTVGQGRQYATLGAATTVAKPGDTIRVDAGVYRETLRPGAGTIWIGEPDAVIDGGWKGNNLATTEDNATGVLVRYADVTVRGFEVRNVPGQGVNVTTGGHRFTMEGCEIHHCFHGGFAANGLGTPIQGITIRNCHVHDIAMSGKWKEVPVNGCFLFKSAHNALVEDCVVERGYGEGMAAGSRSIGVTFRRVTVRDTRHLLMYVNRARDVLIEDCTLYQQGLPEFTQSDGDVGAGLVIGDEESGAKDDTWQHSENVVIRRCLVVNAGSLLAVRNNAKPGKGGDDGYNTNLRNLVVERCTFIAGPQSKGGLNIAENEYGAGNVAGRITANVFVLNRLAGVGAGYRSSAAGVRVEGNAISGMPSELAADNVHIDPTALVNPFAAVQAFALDNYRPRAGGVVAGRGWGALDVAGEEPPPPDDPPPDTEPDWATLLDHLDTAQATLATATLAAEDCAAELAAARQWVELQTGATQ